MTRFRIDWNDGENSENVPPHSNLECESNQMGFDIPSAEAFNKMADNSHASNGFSIANGGASITEKLVLSATSTDSNSMSMEVSADRPTPTEPESMEI